MCQAQCQTLGIQKETGPHFCAQAAFLQSNIGKMHGHLWEGRSSVLKMRTCSDENERIGIRRHKGKRRQPEKKQRGMKQHQLGGNQKQMWMDGDLYVSQLRVGRNLKKVGRGHTGMASYVKKLEIFEQANGKTIENFKLRIPNSLF